MTAIEVLAIVGGALLVLILAAASAAETAFTRMSKARAEALVDEEHRAARTLRELVDRRYRALAPVLFLSVLAEVGLATIVAVFAYRRWGGSGAALALIGAVVATYLIVAVAKARSMAAMDRTALRSAAPMAALARLLPLGWVMRRARNLSEADNGAPAPVDEAVSENQLLAFAEQAAEDKAIGPDEQELIESIIRFDDTTVREVMIPRTEMVTVRSGFAVRDAMEVVMLNGYSRVPVTGEGIDHILGIAHAKDLTKAALDGRGRHDVDVWMREPRFVPETKRISKLLREMQAGKYHLVVVIDEYGGTAGIATLEDIIEELVGEIVDEFDVAEPMFETLDDGSLRANGRASLVELGDQLDTEFPEGEHSTVGGLIFNTLGAVPNEGDVIDVSGHRLTVDRMQGRRIARVLVAAHAASPSISEPA